ncbi:MAG: hypothetical protein BKP49_08645 [Treponema sp. CETP13]|nr:MAG: hypothetical protein BKP49_08645 [Treponema sp. CETP13]
MYTPIIYQDSNVIVYDKPAGMPSAPINANDTKITALSKMIEICPDILSVQGKKQIEYGLVHRIDTATRGLLLAAKNQETFDLIQKDQTEGKFVKFYTAFCLSSSFKKPPFSISTRFRPFGPHKAKVEPVTKDSGRAALKKSGTKVYTTNILDIVPLNKSQLPSHNIYSYENIQTHTQVLRVTCKINQGYRHQVRAHLTFLNLPIIGDKLYGKPIENIPMCFFATGLTFNTPEKKINITLPEQLFFPDIF